MARRGLPDELLVFREKDGDVEYYIANDDLSGIPEDKSGELIGVYTLNKMYTFKVSRELR